jgi:hypothetical protein
MRMNTLEAGVVCIWLQDFVLIVMAYYAEMDDPVLVLQLNPTSNFTAHYERSHSRGSQKYWTHIMFYTR